MLGITDSSANFSVGVEGRADATSGLTVGVRGRVSSPDGNGVRGSSLNEGPNNAAGVLGIAQGTNAEVGGPAGVRGIGAGTSGLNWGVHGLTNSPGGIGVQGNAHIPVGGAGVRGFSDGDGGEGVGGFTNGLNSTALSGHASAGTSFTVGVNASVESSEGVAAIFSNNGGGMVLVGHSAGQQVFSVDGAGTVRAPNFTDLAGSPLFATLNGDNSFAGRATFSAQDSFNIVQIDNTGSTGGGLRVDAEEVAILGITRGAGVGVTGGAGSPGSIGVQGNFDSTGGSGTGVQGNYNGPGPGVGVQAFANGENTFGVESVVLSPTAIAGRFVNEGDGTIISGVRSGGQEVFRVDGDGTVSAANFTVAGNPLCSSTCNTPFNIVSESGTVFTVDPIGRVAAPLLNITGGPDHAAAVISNPDLSGVALQTDGPVSINTTTEEATRTFIINLGRL